MSLPDAFVLGRKINYEMLAQKDKLLRMKSNTNFPNDVKFI